MVLGLLPILCGILLIFPLRGPDGVRAGMLRAMTLFGIAVTVLTELLSLVHAIRQTALAAGWGVLVLAAAFACWRRRAQPPVPGLRWRVVAPLIPLGILAGLTLIVAVAAPPNTWDAINYHLGRVLQWSQHGDVGFYRSNVQRQLFLSPWAEYAVLQFQVLTGGTDLMANLVQWFGYAGCVIAASLLAAALGASRTGQWFAAVMVAALPMALLQASSAQNDLVVSLWLAAFVWFGIRTLEATTRRTRWIELAFTAAALALAVETKGTALIIGSSFVLLGIGWAARQWPPDRVAFAAIVLGLAVTLVNGPLWVRNYQLYGSPLGLPSMMNALRARKFGPDALVSNLSRNAALHLGTPWTGVNHALDAGLRGLHWLIRVDPDDPGLTWTDSAAPGQAFQVPPMNRDENQAGNLLGVLAIAGAVILAAARRISLRVSGYGTACVVAVLTFAVLLRWQPWHSRLHTPLFVLGGAWAASVYAVTISRRLLVFIGLAMMLAGAPWALSARYRPLIPMAGDPPSVLLAPRSSQYFVALPAIGPPFREAARRIAGAGCHTVGYMGYEGSWEYALWALLRLQGAAAQVEPVLVGNRSREAAERNQPAPCAIVTQGVPMERWPDAHVWHLAWHSGDIALFRSVQ